MSRTGESPMVIVRHLERADIPEVLKVQRKASALFLPWTAGQLESHLRNFPEGQWAVEQAQQVVGVASSLRLELLPEEVPLDWCLTTGNGFFHTHMPTGNTLFVADVSIVPGADRVAVRRALDTAIMAVVHEWGLRRVLNACRLPGFAPHAQTLTPEDYLGQVLAGNLFDPVVRALADQGYRPACLLGDLQNQSRSKDSLAALMEWQAHAA